MDASLTPALQACGYLAYFSVILMHASTCAGVITTPFHRWQYKAGNGNMRNFGPTNPHDTAFAPNEWLYQKEATGMESSKMCEHVCEGHSRHWSQSSH